MAKIDSETKNKKKRKRVEEGTEETNVHECEGYKVFRLKCYDDSTAIHYVLAKEHSVREKCEQKPENRTLFLRSIPPFVTKESLTTAFSVFGAVNDIFFHSSPCASVPPTNKYRYFEDVPPLKGFKVAYVVFAKKEHLREALLSPSDLTLTLLPEGQRSKSALERIVEKYNTMATISIKGLKKGVDSYMESYDETQQAIKDAEKLKKEMEEAEDGWITVTKKTGIPRKESVHKRILNKQDKKMQKSQLLNFYKFQIRESKMNQLVKLREKFEDDKKKITQLKEARKFKPF